MLIVARVSFPQVNIQKRNSQSYIWCATLKFVMALFLKQNENRSELQNKVAAELTDRLKTRAVGPKPKVGAAILDDSHEASGRSLVIVGIITAAVIALVIFVLFVFNGV